MPRTDTRQALNPQLDTCLIHHSYLRHKAHRGAKASWGLEAWVFLSEAHNMSNIYFMILWWIFLLGWGISKDKKIDFFGRFFGEKSVFGGAGKDFQVEKSSTKKNSDIFPKKSDFSRNLG